MKTSPQLDAPLRSQIQARFDRLARAIRYESHYDALCEALELAGALAIEMGGWSKESRQLKFPERSRSDMPLTEGALTDLIDALNDLKHDYLESVGSALAHDAEERRLEQRWLDKGGRRYGGPEE